MFDPPLSANSFVLLIFCCLFSGGFANESGYYFCAAKKCPEGEKFAFEPEYSYIYNYEANIATTISGSTEDFTSIYIEAQLELHAATPCEFLLKLRNVQLRSRDVDDPAPQHFATGHDHFKSSLEKYSLRFVFEDGAIDTLCPHEEEEAWVLNVKRAILSSLQNRASTSSYTGTQLIERDIQGDCPTEYILNYEWTSITAKKTKDLDKCANRHLFLSAIQSSPYAVPQGGQLNPALRSSYKCEQNIDENVITRVSCDERHVLRPFSSSNAGAMTLTKQTLVLLDQIHRPAIGAEKIGPLQRTSLLFDHDYGTGLRNRIKKSGDDTNIRRIEAERVLFDICQLRAEDVDFPQRFYFLVKILQGLDYSDLKAIHQNANHICKTSFKGQKFIHDALPLGPSVASVTLIRDLIAGQSVPMSVANSWLDTLAFYPKPTLDVLSAILPLLKEPKPSSKAMLSISAMANTFCQQHDDCTSIEEIRTLIATIEKQLGPNCKPNFPENTQQMIVALKSYGNIGYIHSHSAHILDMCVSAVRNPTTLRLAAIESYRKLSCNITRSRFMSIFDDQNEDSEIRIAAYLGLMRCPSANLIENLLTKLQNEHVNQVRSFVWSHLRSLKESVDPCKKDIAALLQDVDLDDNYAQDIRKYSRAIERSLFSETRNFGAHMEGHLIYTPKSFLPRSATLNLTVDLFGQTINLFELNGRAEGFERLAEGLFRPEPDQEDHLDNSPADDPNGHQQHGPEDNQIRQLSQTVQTKLKNLFTSSPGGSLSLKVFGQEVWYEHANQENVERFVQDWAKRSWTDYLDLASKDNSLELTKDTILMNTTYVVPTVSGLPLILSLNATASMHLKLSGRVDIRSLWSSCDIEGQIKPTGSVSLSGFMNVDGYVGKSGVKIEANLRTSTLLDGKLDFSSDGNRVKIHLNMPQDKIDFAQFSSNLVLNHWGKQRPLRSILLDRTDTEKCLTNDSSQYLGVEFCYQVKYPNGSQRADSPYFPLTGPADIGLWIKKTDPLLSTFHFEYRNEKESTPAGTSKIFLLSFRTPNAAIDREWTIDFNINPVDKTLLFRAIAPFKKIIVKGRYSAEVTRKMLNANVLVDGDDAFSLQSELQIVRKEDFTQYHPKLILRVPTHVVVSVEGVLSHSPGRYGSVDLTVENLTNKQIVIRGEILKNEEYDSIRYDLVLTTPMLEATVKGSVSPIEGGLASKTSLEYKLSGRPKKESVDLTMKLRYSSPSPTLTTANAVVDVHTSMAPEYNLLIHWDFQFADGHLENTVKVGRTVAVALDSLQGGSSGSKSSVQPVAYLQEIFKYEGSPNRDFLKMLGKLEVNVPSRGVHFLLNVDHQNTEQMFHTKMHVQRSVGREYGLEVRIRDDHVAAPTTTLPDSPLLWRLVGYAMVNVDGDVTSARFNLTEEMPRHYVVRFGSQGHGWLLVNSSGIVYYVNRNGQLDVSQYLKMEATTDDLRFRGDGSLFLTDDRGMGKASLIWRPNDGSDDEDDDTLASVRQVEWHYHRVRVSEYESEFTIKHDRQNAFSGVAKLRVGDEKALSFDLKAGAEGGAGRRVVGNTSLIFFYEVKKALVALAWDADNDLDQRLDLSVDHVRVPEVAKTTLALTYLRSRAVAIEVDHHQRGFLRVGSKFEQTNHVLVEWAGTRKLGANLLLSTDLSHRGRREIHGRLDFLTPFTILETVVANVSHWDDGYSWRSDGAVAFDRGRLPFKVSSSGKSWKSGNQHHLDAKANASLPFEGFDNVTVVMEHFAASRELKSSAKILWSSSDNDVLEIRATGIRPMDRRFDRIAAEVNVTSPFFNFRHIGCGINHRHAARRVQSRMHFRWNQEEMVHAVLDGGVNNPGKDELQVHGKLMVVTPLHGFDNFTAVLLHSHSARGFGSHLYGRLPADRPFSLLANGGYIIPSRDYSEMNINGSVNVTVPSAKLNAGFFCIRNGPEIHSAFRGGWNNRTIDVGAHGFYKGLVDFELNATVEGVLEATDVKEKVEGGDPAGWQNVALLVLKNRIETSSIQTLLKARLGAEEEDETESGLTLVGRWNLTAGSINGTFRLDSPVASLPHVTLTVDHGRFMKSDVMLLHSTLSGTWNDLRYWLNHSLSMHDRLNFEDVLLFHLPFDGLEHIGIIVNQTLKPGALKSNVELSSSGARLLSTGARFQHSRMSDGRRILDGALTLQSSIWLPHQVEILVEHEDDGIEYRPRLTWQTMEPEGQVLYFEGYLHDGVNEDGGNSSKAWKASLTTRVPGYETISTDGAYSVAGTGLDFRLAAQLGKFRRLEVDGGAIIDFQAPRLHLNLKTPWEAYSVFRVDGNYNVRWASKRQASFFVQKGDWKIGLAGQGSFETDLMNVDLVVTTPDPEVGIIFLNVSSAWMAVGSQQGMKASLSWAGNKMLLLSLGLNQPKNGVSALKATVITPLDWLRHAEGIAKVSGGPLRSSAEAVARWNREHVMEATYTVGHDPKFPLDVAFAFECTAKDMLPLAAPIAVVIQAKTGSNFRSALFKAEMAGGRTRLKADVDLKYRGRRTDLEVQLDTPFSGLPYGAFVGHFQRGGSTSQGHRDSLNVEATLRLPIAGLENVTVEGQLVPNDETADFRGSLQLRTPEQTALMSTAFDSQKHGYRVSFLLDPPLRPWKVSAMEMAFMTDSINGDKNRSVEAKLVTSEGGRHETFWSLVGPSGNARFVGRLSSPFLMDRQPLNADGYIVVKEPLSITTCVTVKEANVIKHRLFLDLTTEASVYGNFSFSLASPLLLMAMGSANAAAAAEYNASLSITDTDLGIQGAADMHLGPLGHFYSRMHYEHQEVEAGSMRFLVDAGSPLEQLRRFCVEGAKSGNQWDNIDVRFHLLTPIDGYHKFSTVLVTRHVLGKAFDTLLEMDTPFEGYENMQLEQHLDYQIPDLTTINGSLGLTFDGMRMGVGGHLDRKGPPGVVDFGAGTYWKSIADSADLGPLGNTSKINGKARFDFRCREVRDCSMDYVLVGSPWSWGGEGLWNYTGWKDFGGHSYVDTPFSGTGRVGIEVFHRISSGTSYDGDLGFLWDGKKVADLRAEGSVVAGGVKRGSFNLTTPFSIVKQVDGRASLDQRKNGLMGGLEVDVNGQILLDSAVEWNVDTDGPWTNRTIILEMDNVWQPIGFRALAQRRQPDFWSIRPSFVWNFQKRSENSLDATVEVRSGPFGREVHLGFVHPKHQGQLLGKYNRQPGDFSHETLLRWGPQNFVLANYRIWLKTAEAEADHGYASSSDGGRKKGVRYDVGLRWEHPGRVVLWTADVFQRPRFYQAAVGFKWDASKDDKKHVMLDVDYEDASNADQKQHKIIARMHHPKLAQPVEVTANAMMGKNRDLFNGLVSLQYSQEEKEKLIMISALRDVSSAIDGLFGVDFALEAQHAASDLNLALTSELLRTSRGIATNTTFVYLNKDGQRKRFSMEGMGDFVNENGTFQLLSPVHLTNFFAQLHHSDPNNYTLLVLKDIDHIPQYTSRFLYQPENPYLNFNITSVKNGSSSLLFSGGFETPRISSLDLHHEQNGTSLRDFSAILRLNSTRLLTARVYWATNILQHFQESVEGYLKGLHRQVMTSVGRSWNIALTESSEKFVRGWRRFSVTLQPVVDEIHEEVDAILDDFTHVQDYLNQMYYDNDLFIQDIVNLLEKLRDTFSLWYMTSEPFDWSLESLLSVAEKAVSTLHSLFASLWSGWMELMDYWISQIMGGSMSGLYTAGQLMVDLWSRAGQALNDLPEFLAKVYSSVNFSDNGMMESLAKLSAIAEPLKNIWGRVVQAFDSAKLWISDKFNSIVSWIVGSEPVVYVRRIIADTLVAVIDLVRYQLIELFERVMTVVKGYMSEDQKEVMNGLLDNLSKVRDSIWSIFPAIAQHPLLGDLVQIARGFYSKVVWILTYYELIPEGHMTLLRLYGDLHQTFTVSVEESSSHFDSPNFVQFSPDKGLVEMDQQLPFPWKAIRNGPIVMQMKEIAIVYGFWKRFHSQEDDTTYHPYAPPLMAWYYHWKKKLDYSNWLPPYEGQALFAGRQHYITFDGRMVEFAGTCTYLLAHDFVDGNFTVAVNYEGGGGSGGGRPMKRSVSVWMSGREIELYPNYQVFVNGKKVELPQAFGQASVWRELNRILVRSEYGALLTCNLVRDVCTLRVSGWYFGRVAGLLGSYNYEPLDDVVTPDGQEQGQGQLAVWGNAWALNRLNQCRAVQNLATKPLIKDPAVSGLCYEYFNNTYSMFKHCYKKVDPEPFLRMCLSDVQTVEAPEDLCTSAAAYVESCSARDVPIRMPRLCVTCVAPDGQVLAEASNITVNSSTKLSDVIFVIEAKECNRDVVNVFPDLVSNIDSALLRAGVKDRRYASVVFGGSGVLDKPHVHTADNPDYPEIHRMLLEDGITVHLLLDREFGAKRPDLFYGIDGVNAYTSKDARSRVLSGDSDLRRQVAPPKDLYVPIALESNGTVFSSLRLYESKKTMKSFVDVFSRRLAHSAQSAVCHTCDCLPGEDGVGRLYCQPCVFPKPAHVYMSPDEFFEGEYISIYQKFKVNAHEQESPSDNQDEDDFVFEEKMNFGEASPSDIGLSKNATATNLTKRPHGLSYASR